MEDKSLIQAVEDGSVNDEFYDPPVVAIDFPLDLEKICELGGTKRPGKRIAEGLKNFSNFISAHDEHTIFKFVYQKLEQKALLSDLKKLKQKKQIKEIISYLEKRQFSLENILETRRQLEEAGDLETDVYACKIQCNEGSEKVVVDMFELTQEEKEIKKLEDDRIALENYHFSKLFPNIDPCTGEERNFEKERAISAENRKMIEQDEEAIQLEFKNKEKKKRKK